MSPSIETRESRDNAWEFKFLVPPAVGEQIRDWGRARLLADPNGSGTSNDTYQIASIYFDTEAFDVFHRNGSYGRGKYRIRRYGAESFAFLERKLRTKALLVKRRTAVGLHEVHRLEDRAAHQKSNGFWFYSRLFTRRLRPVCQISYCRTARIAMTSHGPIRLTVDEELRALPVTGFQFHNAAGPLILPDHQVVELKFRHCLPALFKNLIEEFALNLQRFSKYRQATASLGLVAPSWTNVQSLLTPQYA